MYNSLLFLQCQRHQMILPDGKRAGFFLADGTGVGKGRQVSFLFTSVEIENYVRLLFVLCEICTLYRLLGLYLTTFVGTEQNTFGLASQVICVTMRKGM